MSRVSFENYGQISRDNKEKSYTLLAGRLKNQEESERCIFQDVIKKLEITSSDKVLDIGSGPGNIAIPLSFICEEMTVVDHQDVLLKLKDRCNGINNLSFLDGNFIDMHIDKKFDKIIVYSVLHYLKNNNEVIDFILKAISMLEVGGLALFGDIPNISKKERFSKGQFGKDFISKWNKISPPNSLKINNLKQDNQNVVFDDNAVMSIIKKVRLSGFHAYILQQKSGLPFCYSREDILVVHPDSAK